MKTSPMMCLLLVAALFGVISLAEDDVAGKNSCYKDTIYHLYIFVP